MQVENNIKPENDKATEPVPFMNSLTAVVNKVVKDGYTDNFMVKENVLVSSQKEKDYKPEEVTIVNFYRFEGQSDPADSAILYIIETGDGGKGTLVDAYGTYADGGISTFMEEVEEINKRIERTEHKE